MDDMTSKIMHDNMYSMYDIKSINVDKKNKTANFVYDWQDLDDMHYNNHFIHGQCMLKVEFNREMEDRSSHGIRDPRNPKDKRTIRFQKTIIRQLPIYPEDITFGATTNYASTEIIGRPGVIAGYVSTSDVTTRINLHLHRELEIPGYVATNDVHGTIMQDRNKIDDIVALIQACAYPRVYSDGLVTPIVTYQFGDTIITGKQTSWNVKWCGPKIGNAYMEVILDVAISHAPKGIEYFDDIYLHNPRQFE